MTKAQREALSVLVRAGYPIEGGKERSRLESRPYVNMRAAQSLCRMRLARRVLYLGSSPFAHRDKYVVTDAGREAYARLP